MCDDRLTELENEFGMRTLSLILIASNNFLATTVSSLKVNMLKFLLRERNIKGGGHAKIQKYFFCINVIFDICNSP